MAVVMTSTIWALRHSPRKHPTTEDTMQTSTRLSSIPASRSNTGMSARGRCIRPSEGISEAFCHGVDILVAST